MSSKNPNSLSALHGTIPFVQEPLGPVETYAVNGINYTTYTTFRSPLTPDDNR